ncbi:TPA: hypothetical protein U2T46_002987 [Burkholderia cenocepacia]|nr:hypothetical protein [Burkholderia cenocepacia]
MWFKKNKQQTEQPKILSEAEDWAQYHAEQRARQEREDRELEERMQRIRRERAAERAADEARMADPNYRSPTAMYIAPRANEQFSAENVSRIIEEAFKPQFGPTGLDLTLTKRWPEGAAQEVCARLVAAVPSIVSAMLNEMHEAARQDAVETVHSPQATFVDVTDNSPTRGTFYS